jgi:hypothetical protein
MQTLPLGWTTWGSPTCSPRRTLCDVRGHAGPWRAATAWPMRSRRPELETVEVVARRVHPAGTDDVGVADVLAEYRHCGRRDTRWPQTAKRPRGRVLVLRSLETVEVVDADAPAGMTTWGSPTCSPRRTL